MPLVDLAAPAGLLQLDGGQADAHHRQRQAGCTEAMGGGNGMQQVPAGDPHTGPQQGFQRAH